MKCSDLASKIEAINPLADARDIARMCALICNAVPDRNRLADDEYFLQAWEEVNLRLQAAADQHAAVTEELESFAGKAPEELTAAQIGVLARSIKIQNQLLQFYIGETKVPSDSSQQ